MRILRGRRGAPKRRKSNFVNEIEKEKKMMKTYGAKQMKLPGFESFDVTIFILHFAYDVK